MLYLCLNFKFINNIMECCNILLLNKIDINVKNVWGRIFFIGVIVVFRYNLVKALIVYNVDVNLCDFNGFFLVIICCSYGNLELFELLV